MVEVSLVLVLSTTFAFGIVVGFIIGTVVSSADERRR